jgi:hypothetical protein
MSYAQPESQMLLRLSEPAESLHLQPAQRYREKVSDELQAVERARLIDLEAERNRLRNSRY